MILRDFYIQNHHDRFLRENKDRKMSEHVRIALDDYIKKYEKENLKISTSKS